MEWPLAALLVLTITFAMLISRRSNKATIRKATFRWLRDRIVRWTAAWVKNRRSRRRAKLGELHRLRTFHRPDHRPNPDPWLWR